jgi:hypothetical protein
MIGESRLRGDPRRIVRSERFKEAFVHEDPRPQLQAAHPATCCLMMTTYKTRALL